MFDLAIIGSLVALVAVGVSVRRNRKSRRKSLAATSALTVTTELVERHLADGRIERAHWAAVQSVEVVCTPVKTADGANAFVLIAEGAEAGCLVPLGVGYDDELYIELSRLRGFRIDALSAATEHRPPKRTMVWERNPATH